MNEEPMDDMTGASPVTTIHVATMWLALCVRL